MRAVSNLPKARERERATVFHLDVVRDFSAQNLAPFIEPISRNETPALLESLPVRRCGIDCFNPRIDCSVCDLFVFRPVRYQTRRSVSSVRSPVSR